MALRLHKEHGLNPTMPVCIVCGKEKGEIVLLGAAYKEQAPMHMLFDPEPCDACRKKYLEKGKGVLLAEAESDKRLTGRCWVIKEAAFKKIFNVPLPPKRIAFAEVGLAEKVGLGAEK